jgi:hypothetical protein
MWSLAYVEKINSVAGVFECSTTAGATTYPWFFSCIASFKAATPTSLVIKSVGKIRNFIDQIGKYDINLSKVKSKFKVIAELFGNKDIYNRTVIRFRTIVDKLSKLDSITRSGLHTLMRIITENFAMIESRSGIKSKFRTLVDIIGKKEIYSRISTKFRIITDALGKLETLTKNRSKFKTLVELFGNKYNYNKVKSKFRILTDIFGGLDTRSKIKFKFKTIIELFGSEESIGKILKQLRALFRTIEEDFYLDYDNNKAISKFKTIIDNIGKINSIEKTRNRYREIIEYIGNIVIISKYSGKFRTIINKFGTKDSIIRSVFYNVVQRIRKLLGLYNNKVIIYGNLHKKIYLQGHLTLTVESE